MNDHRDITDRLRTALTHRAATVRVGPDRFDPRRATNLDTPDAAVPPVPAPRRRRLTVVVVAAAVLVVAAITIVTRGPAADPPETAVASHGSEPGAVAPVDPATLTTLNGLFVATADEYNGDEFRSSWPNYATWAVGAGVDRCLVGDGAMFDPDEVRVPAAAGSVRNNTQFPDIDALAAGTFTDAADHAGPASTNGGSPAAGIAPRSGDSSPEECLDRVGGPYRSLDERVQTYLDLWGAAIAGIGDDPTVVAARSDYVACMADRGLTVTAERSDQDVFALADDATRRQDTAVVAELAKAYGACFAPVSDAMDAYRVAARDDFYASHAEALVQLADDIDTARDRLRAEYDLPRG